MIKSNGMKTPLAEARGLGIKIRLGALWHQRLTAIAMIGLVVWMCVIIVMLVGADYSGAMTLLSHPVNAALIMLFIGVGFGIQFGSASCSGRLCRP